MTNVEGGIHLDICQAQKILPVCVDNGESLFH
jgi:hypothetical protein